MEKQEISFEKIVQDILKDVTEEIAAAEQFCEEGEDGTRRYNVYKVCGKNGVYVLKKSDAAEIYVYENLLENHELPVPIYYGAAEWNTEKWILMEYVKGTDLRNFTEEMAYACAESITKTMNLYWQENETEFMAHKVDDRFERYWKRINKRAECLKNEPEIKHAYEIFLERQLSEPRTLCNGDFLQFNALYADGGVTIIDWAFAGIMPYALDIARLIVHGTEDRRTFPFYMTDVYRKIYVQKVYELLKKKPAYDRYILDIKLAALNECVEFIESELNDVSLKRNHVFAYYYEQALDLARNIEEAYGGGILG